jgi:hypothetical protein
MVGSGLKACREMQYFLLSIGKQTRPRSLTQYSGDLSIMLGTGDSRRQHHRMTSEPLSRLAMSVGS